MRLGRYLPEFLNASTEHGYRLAAADRDVRFARNVLLVGNTVSIPFILNDYRVLGLSAVFGLCVACRLLWILAGAAAWRALRGHPTPNRTDRWMLTWMFFLLAGAVVIAATRPGSYITGLFGFQAIALACYMTVPFRYVLRLGCGIFGSLTYLLAQGAVHAINSGHLAPVFFSLTITNVVGALAAFQIETSRRQSYRRLLRLREAKRIAEQANLSKSRFLAAASHDLRQPVHSLGLFLGALHRQRMSAPAREIVDHMSESIRSLGELFNALLDVSSLDAGAVEPQFTCLSLDSLLKRVCRDLSVQAKAKNLTLKFYARPLFVRSDPVMLERVLCNLVSNAVRYTEHGRVVVGCRRAGDRVEVRVFDTGRGIAPGEQARIFEEFYAIDRSAGGLGLGLAIVQRLTALLNISLRLESQIGKGSMFALKIPAAARPQLEEQGDYSRLSCASALLIGQDEPAIAKIRSLLNSWGLQVIAARSYDETLGCISAESPAPDLVICDMQPGNEETAPDVIAHLRKRFDPLLPALIISNEADLDRVDWRESAHLVLLRRPVSNAKLRAAVGALMRERIAPPHEMNSTIPRARAAVTA